MKATACSTCKLVFTVNNLAIYTVFLYFLLYFLFHFSHHGVLGFWGFGRVKKWKFFMAFAMRGGGVSRAINVVSNFFALYVVLRVGIRKKSIFD